jgi:hypothetical protein
MCLVARSNGRLGNLQGQVHAFPPSTPKRPSSVNGPGLSPRALTQN